MGIEEKVVGGGELACGGERKRNRVITGQVWTWIYDERLIWKFEVLVLCSHTITVLRWLETRDPPLVKEAKKLEAVVKDVYRD